MLEWFLGLSDMWQYFVLAAMLLAVMVVLSIRSVWQAVNNDYRK